MSLISESQFHYQHCPLNPAVKPKSEKADNSESILPFFSSFTNMVVVALILWCYILNIKKQKKQEPIPIKNHFQ
jgi:cytoskeletal protein RodZ